jgi:outer membrane protein OmpA-like peptidoglycan-associated protein
MRLALFVASATCAGAAPLLGQSQPATASAPLPGRLTLDLLAAGRKISGDLVGEHVWGGGGMVALEYRPVRMLGIAVGALGASTPQLNFKDQALLNEISPSLAVVWHAGQMSGWAPYAVTGVAWQRFKVDEPAANMPARTTYTATHLGAGITHDLTRLVGWKAELNAQTGGRGTSYGFLSGLTVRLSGRAPAPAPQTVTRIVHDTTVVRDTVVMTRTTMRTDTLVVHDTVNVDRPREVTRVVRGADVILTLKDANFDFARSNLRPEAGPILDTLAMQLLVRERPIRILVVGHTDDIGSDSANLALGRARAKAVRDYLVWRGVGAERVEIDSDGESHPVASNGTAAGRQLNRRIVISRIP